MKYNQIYIDKLKQEVGASQRQGWCHGRQGWRSKPREVQVGAWKITGWYLEGLKIGVFIQGWSPTLLYWIYYKEEINKSFYSCSFCVLIIRDLTGKNNN